MREEPLIRGVKPFKKFLHGLGPEPASGYTLLEMRFQSIDMYISFIKRIIPFLQGESVIPYECGFAQHLVKIPVPIGIVHAVFVCNHIY